MCEAMKSFQVVFLAPLGCRRDPVPAQDVAHRLIGDGMAEIGQRSDNPIVSPTGVLPGEADNKRLHFGRDWRSAGSSAEFGAVEFTSNEAAVPSKDGIGLGDTGHLLERSATEPFAYPSEGGSFRIGKAHAGRKVCAQDPIFSDEVLILEQEFLIDHPGYVR